MSFGVEMRGRTILCSEGEYHYEFCVMMKMEGLLVVLNSKIGILKRCLSIAALPASQEKLRTYKLSNFSISAWEYEAPTTKPGSRLCFFGDESRRPSEARLLQKGEAVLRVTVSAMPFIEQASSHSAPSGTVLDLGHTRIFLSNERPVSRIKSRLNKELACKCF